MSPAIALVLLLAIGTAHADTALDGDPLPSNPLEDPDFHVASSQFGLERRVEMYQWRRDVGGYSKVWNSAPIDSSTFAAPHRSPARLPIRNRQWWVDAVTLDGRPLPLATVRLLGQWHPLRP